MSTNALVRLSRTALTLIAVLSLGGCALMGRGSGEGPFLRAGEPIGPLPGYAPSPMLGVEDAVITPAGVPAGYTARGGVEALSTGYVPGVGPVEALVISLSLGRQQPTYLDADLLDKVFGASEVQRGTVARELYEVSRGGFRFNAQVLPTLIDPRRAPAEGEVLPLSELRELTIQALREWSASVDLSAFDNDGPDGIPSSVDDDKQIDMLFLAVESDHRIPSQSIKGDFTVRSGSRSIKVGRIHVLSIPRTEALRADEAVGLVFDALGLDHGERFFPAGFPRYVSSIARSRLGWIPVRGLTRLTGTFALEDQAAVTVPLRELELGAGFWLLERDEGRVYASRAARKQDGHYYVVESHHLAPGAEKMLTLNRQLGARGPSARLSWTPGTAHPTVEMLESGPGAEWAMSRLREATLAAEARSQEIERNAGVDGASVVGVALNTLYHRVKGAIQLPLSALEARG